MKTEKGNINQRQKEFYETKKKNFPTRVWSYFRNGIVNKVRKDLGVEHEIYQLHKKWLGDLSGKKVLDLGCYEGNALSYHLALNSKTYIGIDLSERGISILNEKFKNIPQARGIAVDFLSDRFKEKDFDIIYAYGVLHHFKDTKVIIKKLKEKLTIGGLVITNDPLQTSLPVRFLRFMYRPFQSDKEWEWPFSKNVYYQYKDSFQLVERRGVLGKAKWAILLYLLPFSSIEKTRIGNKWHQEDWEKSYHSENHLFKCMHLTMLLKKRD